MEEDVRDDVVETPETEDVETSEVPEGEEAPVVEEETDEDMGTAGEAEEE